MTNKEILKKEIEHRLNNYTFFGYDEKPTKEKVKQDVLNNFDDVVKLYESEV